MAEVLISNVAVGVFCVAGKVSMPVLNHAPFRLDWKATRSTDRTMRGVGVGIAEGLGVGVTVGVADGTGVGADVGEDVGVGTLVAIRVGTAIVAGIGARVGVAVGAAVQATKIVAIRMARTWDFMFHSSVQDFRASERKS